jgi:hypothetical protein
MPSDAGRALAASVYAGGAYKPFARLTVAEVRARARELTGESAWGPLAQAAAVGRAWSQLADEMERAGAVCVGELDPEAVCRHAERTWVVPRVGAG